MDENKDIKTEEVEEPLLGQIGLDEILAELRL